MRGFWGEVNVFLRDSWELFYWSLCFPSKLQGRINEVQGEDLQALDHSILYTNSSRASKFSKQYFLVILILIIPIIIVSVRHSTSTNWLLLLTIIVLSYGIGVFSFPTSIGWLIPLLFGLTAHTQSTLLMQVHERTLTTIFKIVPLMQIQQLLSGVGFGAIFLILALLVRFLILKDRFETTEKWFRLENISSVFLGAWLATGNFRFSLLLSGLTGILFYLIQEEFNYSYEGAIVFVGASIIASMIEFLLNAGVGILPSIKFDTFIQIGFLLLVMLNSGNSSRDIIINSSAFISMMFSFFIFVMTPIVTFVEILAQLPLIYYLSYCIFYSLLLSSSSSRNFWMLSPIIIMILLGFFNLGTNILWTIPIFIIFYYRIFPDYLFSVALVLVDASNQILMSWLEYFNLTLLRNYRIPTHYLPALSGELIWLPIPYHAEILANAFHKNPIVTLPEIQRIRSLSLPGYQITTRKLLPLLVADQLNAPKISSEAIQITKKDHPFLPTLIPQFYDDETTVTTSGSHEVDLLLPRFQTIATDLSNALNASTIALRERGLDRIIQNLQNLQTNLPALGLKPIAIKRWTPVILHWQRLIQLELQEQQKLSQGELLNPFQFGNPLRPNRDNIFQGRRKLADRLYRLILDRDRPTLVLYGTRRAGKTSFLLNLSRFLPSDLIPIYLDLQSSAISNSEADFCYGLTRAIHRDTLSQGLKLPVPYSREKFKANPYGTLDDWLDDALPKIDPDRRLLLNLDEFEKIGSAIASGNLSPRLLDQLRSLIQHYDQLAFMFSGVQTLDELGPNWSSYFISVVPIEMGYLEPNEAEDLLRNPDPDFKMHYADGVIEEILCLTCCQPYLVQLIGSCLVNQANQNQTQLATLDLLEAAIPDAFTNGEPYFTNLWTEFTGTTPAEVTAGQQYLIAITTHNLLPTSPKTNVARRRMIRFHLITEENAIEIPLFERWVRDRAIET